MQSLFNDVNSLTEKVVLDQMKNIDSMCAELMEFLDEYYVTVYDLNDLGHNDELYDKISQLAIVCSGYKISENEDKLSIVNVSEAHILLTRINERVNDFWDEQPVLSSADARYNIKFGLKTIINDYIVNLLDTIESAVDMQDVSGEEWKPKYSVLVYFVHALLLYLYEIAMECGMRKGMDEDRFLRLDEILGFVTDDENIISEQDENTNANINH